MFFIIWRGWGILAPLILLMMTGLTASAISSFFHTYNYAGTHHWVYSVGWILGAGLCWLIGKRLNGKPGRQVIDVKTGEQFELKKTHSCFFIPFEYWAVIGVIASIVVLFSNS